jgi:hypothetical protein
MRAQEVSAIKFDPDPTTNRKKERKKERRQRQYGFRIYGHM